MKLVQVSLSARNHLEGRLHGCGGPVKLVQARISARKDEFMYHERSRKEFATLWKICEARGGQFIYQERCRKHFAALWKSSEARACLFEGQE